MKTFGLNKQGPRRATRALTLIELMVIVAVLAVLAWVLLPSHAIRRGNRRMPRMNCINNLKNIGLSFRQFATDANDKFPPMLSTNEGGVRELVLSGPNGEGDPSRTYWIFAALSNELATPKMVVCPADRSRAAISNFYGLAHATPLAQGGQNASVSYFVNLDADETQPQTILAGDRNLSTVTNARRAADWDAFFGRQQVIRAASLTNGAPYWNIEFHKTIHFNRQSGRCGNIGLADGSAQPVTGARVRDQILGSSNDHRIIFPFVPGRND